MGEKLRSAESKYLAQCQTAGTCHTCIQTQVLRLSGIVCIDCLEAGWAGDASDYIDSSVHVCSEQFLSAYDSASHSWVLGMEMRGRPLSPLMGLQYNGERTRKEVIIGQLILCQRRIRVPCRPMGVVGEGHRRCPRVKAGAGW